MKPVYAVNGALTGELSGTIGSLSDLMLGDVGKEAGGRLIFLVGLLGEAGSYRLEPMRSG